MNNRKKLILEIVDYYFMYCGDNYTPVDMIVNDFETIVDNDEWGFIYELIFKKDMKKNSLNKLTRILKITHLIWKIKKEEM